MSSNCLISTKKWNNNQNGWLNKVPCLFVLSSKVLVENAYKKYPSKENFNYCITYFRYQNINFASIMGLDQEYFSKTIKDFGKFVVQVFSGPNEDQKKSLKMNLKAFQNLCDSFEMLNTNESKKNDTQHEHSESLKSNEVIEKVRSDNDFLEKRV